MQPAVAAKEQALAGPILVSLTFDDSIDDIEPANRRDDGIGNRLEDDVAEAVGSSAATSGWGVLTDGDTTKGENACPFVGTVGTARDTREHQDCDVPATFYLNWPRLDETKQGFLTKLRVQQMESFGHEIGGHSGHHHVVPKLQPDSTTVTNGRPDLAEQRLQICWDRKNLSGIARLNVV
ncbi:MAG: hypothetical protein ACOY0T_37865, partial [Myxococcota bacterium]